MFNPVTQSRTFDAQGDFIRMFVPELTTLGPAFIHEPWRMSAAHQRKAGVRIGKDYPAPLVDHAQAARQTREFYGALRAARETSAGGH